MSAELYEGHVVLVRLGNRPDRIATVSHLLDASDDVVAYRIDDDGSLTAFLHPGDGEIAFVRALEVAGVYPMETEPWDGPVPGGHHAC